MRACSNGIGPTSSSAARDSANRALRLVSVGCQDSARPAGDCARVGQSSRLRLVRPANEEPACSGPFSPVACQSFRQVSRHRDNVGIADSQTTGEIPGLLEFCSGIGQVARAKSGQSERSQAVHGHAANASRFHLTSAPVDTSLARFALTPCCFDARQAC